MKIEKLPEVIKNYEKIYGKLENIILRFKGAYIELYEEGDGLHIEIDLRGE